MADKKRPLDGIPRLASFNTAKRDFSLQSSEAAEVAKIVRNVTESKKKTRKMFSLNKFAKNEAKPKQPSPAKISIKQETQLPKSRKQKSFVQQEGTLFGQGISVQPLSNRPTRLSVGSLGGSTSLNKSGSSTKKSNSEDKNLQDKTLGEDWEKLVLSDSDDTEDEEFSRQEDSSALPHLPVWWKNQPSGINKLRNQMENIDLQEPPHPPFSEVLDKNNREPFQIQFPNLIPITLTDADKKTISTAKNPNDFNIFSFCPGGCIGKVVVRKSGKIEMCIGDVKYQATQSQCVVKQSEIIEMTDTDKEPVKATKLGDIKYSIRFDLGYKCLDACKD